jgi:glucose-6-phosphate-specific signal transduction histidine kinase
LRGLKQHVVPRHDPFPTARRPIVDLAAIVTVTDDGVGIPPDVLRRFESLGTSGVGLAGMRERIRELGGEFKVESRGGTSVRVTLPLTAPRSIAADVSGGH